MKKILLSLAIIAAAGAIVVGATTAYFTDTETSTGNTFTAGEINLKIDSTCHYDGLVCVAEGEGYVWEEECTGSTSRPELIGTPCFCSWEESDLGLGVDSKKFFNFTDIKPGDEGENTISIHVLDNNAWGAFTISNIVDEDNTIPEPEDKVDGEMDGLDGTKDGDLDSNLMLTIWLDQGIVAGFQCPADEPMCWDDPYEGDNKYKEGYEPILWTGLASEIDSAGETFAMSPVIADACEEYVCQDGLTVDGHLVGCITYYFGVAWSIPGATGNIAQTDSWGADMTFEVTQSRHQADPYIDQDLNPFSSALAKGRNYEGFKDNN